MSVEMITIFVSIQTAILHGHQLGDYFPNQVAMQFQNFKHYGD